MSDAGWQLAGRGPEAYERHLVPRIFAPWAERLVATAEVGDGDRVLDVGTGTGIVARRAARRVGDSGAVVGVDVNEEMIAVARSASADVAPLVEWRTADAADLPFPDSSFDVVLCQQVLQFAPDPATVLREMGRVLTAGGRLALSVWRGIEHSPVYPPLARLLGEQPGPTPRR